MIVKKYYAVRNGKEGKKIYTTWEDCKVNTEGQKGAKFKGFYNREDALEYLKDSYISERDYQIIAYVGGKYDALQEIGASGLLLLNTKQEQYQIEKENVTIIRHENLREGHNIKADLLAVESAVKYCINNNYKSLLICYNYTGVSAWVDKTDPWKTNSAISIEYRKFMLDANVYLNYAFRYIKKESENQWMKRLNNLMNKKLYE